VPRHGPQHKKRLGTLDPATKSGGKNNRKQPYCPKRRKGVGAIRPGKMAFLGEKSAGRKSSRRESSMTYPNPRNGKKSYRLGDGGRNQTQSTTKSYMGKTQESSRAKTPQGAWGRQVVKGKNPLQSA